VALFPSDRRSSVQSFGSKVSETQRFVCLQVRVPMHRRQITVLVCAGFQFLAKTSSEKILTHSTALERSSSVNNHVL